MCMQEKELFVCIGLMKRGVNFTQNLIPKTGSVDKVNTLGLKIYQELVSLISNKTFKKNKLGLAKEVEFKQQFYLSV